MELHRHIYNPKFIWSLPSDSLCPFSLYRRASINHCNKKEQHRTRHL